MGDAAREQTDRLHLLGLDQHGLRFLAYASFLRQSFGALTQFPDQGAAHEERPERRRGGGCKADQDKAEHDRSRRRFSGLPLAEKVVLRHAELTEKRAEGFQDLLAAPCLDEFSGLGELAIAAELDCFRRPCQHFVDQCPHALDPRFLVGVVGHERPQIA